MRNDISQVAKKIGTLYGIGIGPGDSELLTIKGLRLLKEADFIFAPQANIKVRSLAADIIGDMVPEKKIITIVFPMTKDKSVLEERWKNAAVQIYEKIALGKNVAFVTIGDPGVYSTYTYLLRYIYELNDKILVETVPGISIINATAAIFSHTLVEGDERFAVMPLPKDLNEIKKYTQDFNTIVLLKINKRLSVLVEFLEEEGLSQEAYFVHRLGGIDEYRANSLEKLKNLDESIGYLSTMIIRVRNKGNK